MKTDIEQVEKIIANSGNNFHCKVIRYFKEKGWNILISPYYSDNVSDKPREIDLIAEKAFDVKDKCFERLIGSVNIKLFIECKFIPQKIVFWFHTKNRAEAEKLVINNTPLKKDNSYTEKHHYLDEENNYVAKLFSSDTKKKTENEIVYKAINQSLNAMVYYRNSSTLIPTLPDYFTNIMSAVNYPVILCNNFSNLYRVDIDTANKPVNIKDNFQLEVNYAYLDPSKNPVTEYFLIDIVTFDKIDSLLDALEQDISAIKIMLR